MPTPTRPALPLVLCAALLAPACNRSDPKADASFAKLESESAAHKEELKKSQAAVADLSGELKKVSENLMALRLEFAKAAPGIVALPPPKEERFEKLELDGSFNYAAGKEGVVGFGEQFAHPPSVELTGSNVLVVECTTTGFKWKDTSKSEYTTRANSVWTAKGVRRVLASDAAKADENTKYGKQIAEQFLKTFIDRGWDENRRFVTDDFARSNSTNGYNIAMLERYYGALAPKDVEPKRFKTFALTATALAPNGKEILCTGTLEGEMRKAEFTLILKPAADAGWRVNAFNLTDRK